MSSRLLCRARLLVHKRTRKFGPDSSIANPPHRRRRITLPDARFPRGLTLRPVVRTRWRLQAIEIPAHPLDYGRRLPPSVVGAVRASVQRSRELLRETGVAWSAREVRSVSPPFIPFVVVVGALGGHRLGTTTPPGFPVSYRNYRACRAPRYYVVPGRRDVYFSGGRRECREVFCHALKQWKIEREF